jgi:hypothetical protein
MAVSLRIIKKNISQKESIMSRRTTGVAFIAISAFLFGVRFIAAAIYSEGLTSWDAAMFNTFLSYVDQGLSTTSVIALVLGAVYLVWAELEVITGRKKYLDG